MNPSPKPSAHAKAVLALLLAAFSASAFAQPPGSRKKEAIDESLRRFDLLATQIAENQPDRPELLKIVSDARANFERQANAYLPNKPYRQEEFDTMQEIVENNIKGVERQVALLVHADATNMSAADLRVETNKITQETVASSEAIAVKNGFLPALPTPDAAAGTVVGGVDGTLTGTVTEPGANADAPAVPHAAIADGHGAITNGAAAVAHTVGAGIALNAGAMNLARGPWNGAYFEGDEAGRLAWERGRGENSPVVILGVHSTKCAMGAECEPLKPYPARPHPMPTDPGGYVPWNPPSAGPTNESVLTDIAQAIVAKGGSGALASGSVFALQSGDYRRALSMAQAALRADPSNRSALEVLHAAQGRGDAMGAAAAGAAAIGGPAGGGFAEGGSGAASMSPQVAAAAAAGAARVSGAQARAGAMNAMKLGDPAGALEILSKALQHDPNNPALLNLRAQTYGRLGRWEDALKDASAGLALVPGNMALLTTKALTENRTRRWRDALASSERMIAADPRGPWGYANRAHAWAGLGNRDAMLSDINRAAALDPRFQQAAADAAHLQLPAAGDVMFLFPGEAAKGAAKAPVPADRGRSFSFVVGAGIVGGLLLALGLLSTVLAPLKDTVVSVFTRAKRIGPAANTAVATDQPASVAGNVGGLIRGQYEISRQIGAGGMGMVYEGTDRSLGRRVAIKKMREELRVNARERDRFIIEAKTVASLHHPNIVDIYAIAEEGSDVYLVFEYVDGKTVHDLVQGAGRLDPAESVRVTRAMGEALTYAHAHGVIHRDMKPSNVMVTGAGQIKVMDFGIARMAKDALTRYSMTNTVVGTPPYMAPEQEQGVVRKESDVYSLAICSYEMLTGKMPFIGIGAGMLMNKINMSYIPPSRAIAGLPEALDEVFLKAFQADPDRRYRTPLEFVTALAAAAGGSRKTA